MLKYISYFNLVLAIVLLVMLRSGRKCIDVALLTPSILFNWLTLYHLLKNNLKFAKWHFYVGYISVSLSIISTIFTVILLFEILSNRSIYLGPPINLFLVKLLFDVLTISQFIMAYSGNKKLLNQTY